MTTVTAEARRRNLINEHGARTAKQLHEIEDDAAGDLSKMLMQFDRASAVSGEFLKLYVDKKGLRPSTQKVWIEDGDLPLVTKKLNVLGLEKGGERVEYSVFHSCDYDANAEFETGRGGYTYSDSKSHRTLASLYEVEFKGVLLHRFRMRGFGGEDVELYAVKKDAEKTKETTFLLVETKPKEHKDAPSWNSSSVDTPERTKVSFLNKLQLVEYLEMNHERIPVVH